MSLQVIPTLKAIADARKFSRLAEEALLDSIATKDTFPAEVPETPEVLRLYRLAEELKEELGRMRGE